MYFFTFRFIHINTGQLQKGNNAYNFFIRKQFFYLSNATVLVLFPELEKEVPGACQYNKWRYHHYWERCQKAMDEATISRLI